MATDSARAELDSGFEIISPAPEIQFFKLLIEGNPELWEAMPKEIIHGGQVQMGLLKSLLSPPWNGGGIFFDVFGMDVGGEWLLVNPYSFRHLKVEKGVIKLKLQVRHVPVDGCPWATRHSCTDTGRIFHLSRQSPAALSGYELLYAAEHGCLTCTRALVNAGVSKGFRSVTCGYTPLDFAAQGKQQAKTEDQRQRCQQVIDYLQQVSD